MKRFWKTVGNGIQTDWACFIVFCGVIFSVLGCIGVCAAIGLAAWAFWVFPPFVSLSCAIFGLWAFGSDAEELERAFRAR